MAGYGEGIPCLLLVGRGRGGEGREGKGKGGWWGGTTWSTLLLQLCAGPGAASFGSISLSRAHGCSGQRRHSQQQPQQQRGRGRRQCFRRRWWRLARCWRAFAARRPRSALWMPPGISILRATPSTSMQPAASPAPSASTSTSLVGGGRRRRRGGDTHAHSTPSHWNAHLRGGGSCLALPRLPPPGLCVPPWKTDLPHMLPDEDTFTAACARLVRSAAQDVGTDMCMGRHAVRVLFGTWAHAHAQSPCTDNGTR